MQFSLYYFIITKMIEETSTIKLNCEELSTNLFQDKPKIKKLQIQSCFCSDWNQLLEPICKNLDQLSIINCQFEQFELTFPKLVCLSFSSSKLKSLNFLTQRKAKNLQKLDLSNCELPDSSVVAIVKFAGLKELVLNGNSFDCESLRRIVKTMTKLDQLTLPMENIEEMTLNNAKLSFKQLTLLLKNTPNLKILHLNIQDLNEMAGLPEFICKFSRLEQLSLLRRQIKDDGLRVICENLPKLSIFNIAQCSISAIGALALRPLKSLQTLNLKQNSLDSGSIQAFIEFQSLRVLDLDKNNVGVGLAKLTRYLPFLEKLSISQNKIHTEEAIHLTRNLFCLKTLEISKNQIDCKGVFELTCKLHLKGGSVAANKACPRCKARLRPFFPKLDI